jgi:excinuclease UvrABC nuclease subunit
MKDLKYIYFLTRVDGLGTVRIKRLIDKFNTAENVFNASLIELAEVENISDKTALSILSSVNLHSDYEEQF